MEKHYDHKNWRQVIRTSQILTNDCQILVLIYSYLITTITLKPHKCFDSGYKLIFFMLFIFVDQVSPTDYHRFIYKCHKCLLGFKRRGMLVNHLAKRHPDISLETVPELNLPILKTTKDYFCQYCNKVGENKQFSKQFLQVSTSQLFVPI